jgi:hypothetical protein
MTMGGTGLRIDQADIFRKLNPAWTSSEVDCVGGAAGEVSFDMA